MRVAFSGTHRTGKTTLIEAIAELVPGYTVIEEPYRVLEEEGHELSDPPSVEDFEAQLRRSFEMIRDAPADALIDRCPLDLAAYLQALDEDIDPWLDDIRDTIALLDLVVVVPIETPDRISLPAHEDRRLRRRVDDRLRVLALEDALGLEISTLEVAGGLDERIRQVMQAMRGSRP